MTVSSLTPVKFDSSSPSLTSWCPPQSQSPMGRCGGQVFRDMVSQLRHCLLHTGQSSLHQTQNLMQMLKPNAKRSKSLWQNVLIKGFRHSLSLMSGFRNQLSEHILDVRTYQLWQLSQAKVGDTKQGQHQLTDHITTFPMFIHMWVWPHFTAQHNVAKGNGENFTFSFFFLQSWW